MYELILLDDVEDWKGLLMPWFAARMEVAIRAAMCSIVNPGGSAGRGVKVVGGKD